MCWAAGISLGFVVVHAQAKPSFLKPHRNIQAAGRARPADAKSTRSILSEALRGSSTDVWKAQLHTRYEQDNEELYPGGVRQPLLCFVAVQTSVCAQP